MKLIETITTILTMTIQLGAITADQILDKMEANENPKTSCSKIVQKIYNALKKIKLIFSVAIRNCKTISNVLSRKSN